MSTAAAAPQAEVGRARRDGATAIGVALPWAVVGAALGVAVGRLISSPSEAAPWLGTFVLSPGFAGTVAFLGAALAANVAWRNSRADRAQRRRADLRSQHWERFAWATEHALSPKTSVVGTKVLGTLLVPGEATVEDARMALDILTVIEADGGRRRWRRPMTTRLGSRHAS